MYKLKIFLKKVFTPVTVMLVPHSRTKPVAIKVPFSVIAIAVFLWCAGTIYVISIAVKTYEYYNMKNRLTYFMNQFIELKSTISSLQKAEAEFRKLFSLKSKKDVLEAVEVTDTGSIDMEALKKQIEETVETVTEIKKYLSEQRDIYRSTPIGWPVRGVITSGYGERTHPKYGEIAFHSGIDISVPVGTEIRATADGVVVFSGWTAGSGYTVIIEHGHGFTTAYAHNKENLVKVGQRVKRGDVVALSGNTGVTTGPHVHYEVWKNGTHVNPLTYIKENY
ncbi:MAG: peptidoglycan DD-metalloendopeptidase family protein [Thermodesulfovibrionales bacterium]|nr:peptidoglycan DD-metalloendopeptidase family protein [Thermodesulfovibrionales bacterium]